MHVDLSPERLAFPGRGEDHSALGQCMACGFCTLHCPTFSLLNDERDGPRGRVRYARQIVDEGRPASAEAIEHLDRCLSCLACTSACPYGVDHAGLWDAAREAIERGKARPLAGRLARRALSGVLSSPALFSLGLAAAPLARAAGPVLPRRVQRLLDQASATPRDESPTGRPRVYPAAGAQRMRVALLAGCVQQVLGGAIDAATIRVLTRHGCEVVVAEGGGCCGAVPLHLGYPERAREHARRNIASWREAAADGLDAIVINASGCGSTVKAYDTLLAGDDAWSEHAQRIASITVDVVELLADLPLAHRRSGNGLPVALHLPCSQQHGQGIAVAPGRLLEEAGFRVLAQQQDLACCGAAGSYHLTQPEIAERLGERSARALGSGDARAIASGNLGCLLQIARFSAVPAVHTVELIDWATGGEAPARLADALVAA